MKSAVVSATASGNNLVVAAPDATQFIRVLGYDLTCKDGGPVSQWRSGASTVKDIVASTTVAGGGIVRPNARDGLFDCAAGDPLNLNLDQAVLVVGSVRYALVPPTAG